MFLLVEDDASLREVLVQQMRRYSTDCVAVGTIAAAEAEMSHSVVSLAVIDNVLPDGRGVDLIAKVRASDPDASIVLMTAYDEVSTAIKAIRSGADEFIVKPFELDAFHVKIDRLLRSRSLQRDVRLLKRERATSPDARIVGDSKPMQELRQQIQLVARSDAPVLINGETGTGKELVARAIHAGSKRTSRPMVTINCSAVSETLLEAELFGHEKGAFTGATETRPGLFEMARGGTLFLDEIGEMRSDLQAKLLRAVDGQPFRRVGGQREIVSDVRIIAATNRDLRAEVGHGEFREDLFYRLSTVPLSVPPLRDRGDDIVRLCLLFLNDHSPTPGKAKQERRLTDAAQEVLTAYRWPGNVRELRNVMERLVILSTATDIDVSDLPPEIVANSGIDTLPSGGSPDELLTLEEVQIRYIKRVYAVMGRNLSATSRVLGVARNTLRAKLRSAGVLLSDTEAQPDDDDMVASSD